MAVDDLVFDEGVGNGNDQAIPLHGDGSDLSQKGFEGLASTKRQVLTGKFPQRNSLVFSGIRHSNIYVVHNVFHSCESPMCN